MLISLALTMVVFLEMREQPYELLDQELGTEAKTLAVQIAEHDATAGAAQKNSGIIESRYWVRILDKNLKPVFWSGLSEKADLPLYDKGDDGYTVRMDELEKPPSNSRNGNGETSFRVRAVPVRIHGGDYLVQIARPVGLLDEEMSELVTALCTGLAVSFFLLGLVSYYVAGKIVQPISNINRLTKEINEKTLERRIPLGKSRDEIFELSESLNGMFDRLNLSFRRQKEFLANASHELKSPTSMLRLFFEEAARREDLPESFRPQLLQQGKNALRMERLSKTLLELSALELAPSIGKEIISISEIIQDLLENFSVVFRKKGIQVQVEVPEGLSLAGDKGMIRRMLINLLDNAVKYNNENGEIHVLCERKNGFVNLSVFNTGPGIPTDELNKVFEQFHRVEKSRSIKYGGAGLGLSIVRQIIHLHGGRIRMESQYGQWARVRVALPETIA
jgi:signal transduction histidine kinase